MSELLNLLSAYGADVRGINDRFLGDEALYESCFFEFLEEPNLALLRTALEERNYTGAYEYAHALKGLSGNLGLAPFYDIICILTSSLRAKELDGLELKYKAVVIEYERLVKLAALVSAENRAAPLISDED